MASQIQPVKAYVCQAPSGRHGQHSEGSTEKWEGPWMHGPRPGFSTNGRICTLIPLCLSVCGFTCGWRRNGPLSLPGACPALFGLPQLCLHHSSKPKSSWCRKSMTGSPLSHSFLSRSFYFIFFLLTHVMDSFEFKICARTQVSILLFFFTPIYFSSV